MLQMRTTRLLTTCLCPVLMWAGHNVLLPQPQRVQYGPGHLSLDNLSIDMAEPAAPEDRFAAKELAAALKARAGQTRRLVLRRTGPVGALPEKNEQPGRDSRESYQIRITPAGGEVQARTSAGLFYAVQTVKQLVEGRTLPEVEIEDWPSLAYRGVMMDLSHGPLPTEDEIKRQIDFLARWKGNQYYFYSELSIEL